MPEAHIQAHANQLGARNPTAISWNVHAPRPMHSGHSISQWFTNPGLHRVRHERLASPDRTFEGRKFSRYPLCRMQIWRRWAPYSTHFLVPVGEMIATCPAESVFPDTFILFLTRDAHAMALTSLRLFHTTSMHHTSLLFSVFAATRTLDFHPGRRKQAFLFSRTMHTNLYKICRVLKPPYLSTTKWIKPSTEADSKRE
jgi:hypothetical protein